VECFRPIMLSASSSIRCSSLADLCLYGWVSAVCCLICCLWMCVHIWRCLSVSLTDCLSISSYLSVYLSLSAFFCHTISACFCLILSPWICCHIYCTFLCDILSLCLSLCSFEALSTIDLYVDHDMIVAVDEVNFAFLLFKALFLWLESWKWMCSDDLQWPRCRDDSSTFSWNPLWSCLFSEFCVV